MFIKSQNLRNLFLPLGFIIYVFLSSNLQAQTVEGSDELLLEGRTASSISDNTVRGELGFIYQNFGHKVDSLGQISIDSLHGRGIENTAYFRKNIKMIKDLFKIETSPSEAHSSETGARVKTTNIGSITYCFGGECETINDTALLALTLPQMIEPENDNLVSNCFKAYSSAHSTGDVKRAYFTFVSSNDQFDYIVTYMFMDGKFKYRVVDKF